MISIGGACAPDGAHLALGDKPLPDCFTALQSVKQDGSCIEHILQLKVKS